MPRPRISPLPPRRSSHVNRLNPMALSGANPGNLAAHVYVPARLTARPALVVVLHGCTQTAAGYDHGSGWSTLAERHGFVLLFPEQQRANNGNLCFNWFEPGDVTRDRGEVGSIREMIGQAVGEYDVDCERIFVTGLSAGGAMAAAMLATYPEVFAAGAVIGGLPYGVAASVPEALERMRSGHDAPGAALAARIGDAAGHQGAWPRLSVWHGSADRTVHPGNAAALVRQWAALCGLPAEPTRQDDTAGHPRRLWCASDGRVLIEDNLIAGMGHGTPLAPGEGDERCGTAGAFMLDVGISSSHGIARFFGILEAGPTAAAEPATVTTEPSSQRLPARVTALEPPPRRLEPVAWTRPAPAPTTVQGIIEDALRSAGLMK